MLRARAGGQLLGRAAVGITPSADVVKISVADARAGSSTIATVMNGTSR